LQRIAQQSSERGHEEYKIKDSGHIPTKQFLQKLETQGGYSGNGNAIPEEPMNEGAPMQVQKTFQQLRKKKMTRVEVDTADAKYKQTLRQLFQVKPTPVMQELDKDIKELEQKVKNTPEAMMDDSLVYNEEKKNIEKRKNEAIARRDTKKLHRLEQEEMLLEQERMDNMRLAELQKL
jgi:paraquat-inducible protein B